MVDVVTDFNSLVTAIQDWAQRDDVDADKAAQFVRFTEQDMYNRLRIPVMEVTTTDINGGGTNLDALITTSGRDSIIAFPTNFLGAKDVWSYAADNSANPLVYLYGQKNPSLRRVSVQTFNDLSPWNDSYINYPQFFARNNLEIWIAYVMGPVIVRTTYWARPDFLASDNQTNPVFDLNPEMFLNGALIRAAAWCDMQERADSFTKLYENAISGLQKQADSSELSGSSVVARSFYSE